MVAPAFEDSLAEAEDSCLGPVVVVRLVADPVEKLVQLAPGPTEWLPLGRQWHLSAGGPCLPIAHSVLGVGAQFPSAETPTF